MLCTFRNHSCTEYRQALSAMAKSWIKIAQGERERHSKQQAMLNRLQVPSVVTFFQGSPCCIRFHGSLHVKAAKLVAMVLALRHYFSGFLAAYNNRGALSIR
jgi:hypothetical protein